MRKPVLLLLCCLSFLPVIAQEKIILRFTNPAGEALPFCTAEILQTDSSLVRSFVSDSLGRVVLADLKPGAYLLKGSRVNYQPAFQALHTGKSRKDIAVVLEPLAGNLSAVTVTGKRPLVRQENGKTIVQVEGSFNQAGSTVLELLERSPGVTVDRDGNISLRGRPEVLVMIDGKPTYVSGAELATLLGTMNSNQVESIELMDHPPASFDASGNAGIINIRTKKLKQKGTNATVSLSGTQGRYARTNNSFGLNHRTGAVNLFANFSFNGGDNFTDLYAFRDYYPVDGKPASYLEQPTFVRAYGSMQSLRAGMDYYPSQATSIGFTAGGTKLYRRRNGNGPAEWMDENHNVDSSIFTNSLNTTNWQNSTFNLNLRHRFPDKQELAVDMDWLNYDMHSHQEFSNQLMEPGGYTEKFRGELPSSIRILAAKADYSSRVNEQFNWATGVKASHTKTDNTAAYQVWNDPEWTEDLNRSNRFLYTENIYAAYLNSNYQRNQWKAEAGLRFEHTAYDAHQLGNAARKDSAFSRDYSSFFPSVSVSYQLDSSNGFTLMAGRRIDRPPFQKLNPFTIILNKYTYQAGNPFIRPQYTWNLEASHQYKDLLTTTIGYHYIKDYFMQVFYSDSAGTIIYTDGNLGKMQDLSLSVMLQLHPVKGWDMVLDATFNHKRFEGFVWQPITAEINQLTIHLNNQFRFGKNWSGEIAGNYTTRHQNDITEVLDPTGQLSVGVGRQLFKGKSSLKLVYRDVFYTQAMAGNTYFQHAHEYFKLKYDSRALTLSFTYRFAKGQKIAQRKSSGSAGDEAERVGAN